MDGTIRFAGADARTFLQGQLTQDMQLLAPGQTLLAAHCSPQGRVVAVMELMEDADGILARLPASMLEPLIAKLKRYVLRAKVTMTPIAGAAAEHDDNAQRLSDIAAGRPQVYPATSEAFVAQMLNLDVLGGISFSKGCYTGQEIVARAHYRGKVKRRMQRFRSTQRCELKPGDEGKLSDGRGFQVVQAATLPDGRCEFLAVAPFSLEAADEAAPQPPSGAGLEVEKLPLPYSLVE